MKKSVCMVAGEASADKHASAVIHALKEITPEVEVFGMGGPEMKAAGMECIYGIDEFSVMGFSDVIPRLRHIYSVYKGILKAVAERRPDVVVPVDLPDFNMRLAHRVKRSGIKVLYYIAPQAWAWRRYRARTLSRITDGLAVIFPFEEGFFSSYGVNARYVGHPFMESGIGQPSPSWPPKNIVLMPGSRLHEIETILPSMLGAKQIVQKKYPGILWHLRMAPGLDKKKIEAMVGSDVALTADMPPADLAVVKSGTSCFEMAVMGIPEVICYRTSAFNYRIAKAFVTVDHIGMPNIILGRCAVPEVIQDDLTPETLAHEVIGLIEDKDRYREMQCAFAEMRKRLGSSSPSQGVASWIQSMTD
ncbi:MAG TPA: lipid-A-disaccharide synthase [Deltaproteobacteria bacterium]|nr:lipid-A-disaccharide synthase [Deltaproteobacteria bacterium]